MKKLYLTFILLFLTGNLFSQSIQGPPEIKSRNFLSTIYLEFGGSAVFTSINYDLMINKNYGIRIGASPGLFLTDLEEDEIDSDQTYDFTGLIGAFKIFGLGKHTIETGVVAVFGETNTPRNTNYPAVPAITFNTGYRFISSKERGLSFRAMFNPSVSKNGFIPWIGASVGISFKNNTR